MVSHLHANTQHFRNAVAMAMVCVLCEWQAVRCVMALHLRWNVLWQQFDTTIWQRLLLFSTLSIPLAVAVAHNSISRVFVFEWTNSHARTHWALISLDETIHPYKWLSLWLASCVVSFDFQVIRSNSLSMYALPHGHRTKYSSPFTVYIDAVSQTTIRPVGHWSRNSFKISYYSHPVCSLCLFATHSRCSLIRFPWVDIYIQFRSNLENEFTKRQFHGDGGCGRRRLGLLRHIHYKRFNQINFVFAASRRFAIAWSPSINLLMTICLSFARME